MRIFWSGIVVLASLLVLVGGEPAACGGTLSKAVREATEFILRKFGKKTAQEGTETLSRRLQNLAARHGEEALVAARKAGPFGIKAVEEAGEHSEDVVRLLARHGEDALWITAKPDRMAIFIRYGDDAAAAMVRHRQIAASLIERFGAPGARAVKDLSGRNARRLAMMMDEGQLDRLGRSDELLDVIARYGDRAMEFVWRHKAALAGTAVLAAFLADPEPFLNGTRDLAEIAAENVAKPLANVPGKVAEEAARSTNWTVVAVTGLVLFAALGAGRLLARSGGVIMRRVGRFGLAGCGSAPPGGKDRWSEGRPSRWLSREPGPGEEERDGSIAGAPRAQEPAGVLDES